MGWVVLYIKLSVGTFHLREQKVYKGLLAARGDVVLGSESHQTKGERGVREEGKVTKLFTELERNFISRAGQQGPVHVLPEGPGKKEKGRSRK